MTTPIVHESTAVAEANNYNPPDRKIWIIRALGLVGGILLAYLVYTIFPHDAGEVVKQSLSAEKAAKLNLGAMGIVAAVAVLMAVWWMTEAIPLAATALIPMVIFPLLSVDTFAGAAGPYASDIIYLFMGGFVLALAMQRWNLHRRIALTIVSWVGTKPRRLIGGFMIATAFLSMWVSNTATTVMMIPIGLSVLQLVSQLTKVDVVASGTEHPEEIPEVAHDATKGGALAAIVSKGRDTIDTIKERAGLHHSNFAVALMLSIAYAASIGSLGTIIGTPPNALLAAYMKENHDYVIGFGQWMIMGVPLAVVFLAIGWFLITFVIFPPEIKDIPGGRKFIREELKSLGRMSLGEILVGLLFALAALSWVFLPLILKNFGITIKGLDTIVAMSISLLLFIIPADAKRGVRLINWETAKDIPWDILLLFGGGLALSGQFSKTGLSNWIGEQVGSLSGLPIILLILIITGMVIFLTEMTSNTATAAAFLPIIGGIAMGLGYHNENVLLFVIPVAVAATCAFMLPVATPPNAIAYGSGYVKMSDMIKVGFYLNIIGIALITITVFTIAVPVFGLSLTP